MTGLLDRLLAIIRLRPQETSWLAPGNSVTRAIESGRALAELPTGSQRITFPRPSADRDFMAAIEAALTEPVIIEEAPRIVITDDMVAAAVVDDPAIEGGVLKSRDRKRSKKRWWRAA